MSAEPTVKHEQEQLMPTGENTQSLPWANADQQQYYTTQPNQAAPTDQPPGGVLSQTNTKSSVNVDQQSPSTAMQEGLEKSVNTQEAPPSTYQTPIGSTHPSIHPQPGQPMDLHENGTLLQQFGATTAESEVPGAPQNVGQTVAHNVSQASPTLNQSIAPSTVSQGMSLQVTQNGTQAMPQPSHEHPQTVRVVAATGVPQTANTVPPMQHPLPPVGKEIRKPTRMPGTKQCPSCQGTIAAAVAKCPKCDHVFRAKKEKPKRSGKRGKKNCPKCQFENPSACSTCKSCKYVFRLKLMDRYKQMRPRANEPTATTAAGAIVVVSSMGAPQAPTAAPPVISTSGSLPMPSGVQQYHPQIQTHVSQPMHPTHPAHGAAPAATTVIPPLSVAMHHTAQPHNVHTNVQGLHQMPQHPMQPHQPHQPHQQL